MSISLLRRCILDHRKLFVCVPATTTLFFFDSISGIGKQRSAASFCLSNFRSLETKNKYKSLTYKLLQSFTKDKSFVCNSVVIYFGNKKYLNSRIVVALYKSLFKKIKLVRARTKQSLLINQRGKFSFKSVLFLYNISHLFRIFSINSCVDCVSMHSKDILRSYRVCDRKELIFGLSNFIQQIYNNARQKCLRNLHNINVDTREIFYHLVLCK